MAVSSCPGKKAKVAAPVEKLKKAGKKEVASPGTAPGAQEEGAPPSQAPKKRNKDPGVRVIGGRIYDPQNGKTCHQCRQKTMDFFAPCKNVRKDKPCPFCFCHKCLLNRYGEKAGEVATLENWMCPKCRGVCNCSFCMKKKGHKPTGILVHTAKAVGFTSVSELLQLKGPEAVEEMINSTGRSPVSMIKKKKKNDEKKPSSQDEESNQEQNASASGNNNEENVETKQKKKTAVKKRKHLSGDNHGDLDTKKEKAMEPNLLDEESNQEENASASGENNEKKAESKKKKKTAAKKRKHLLGDNHEDPDAEKEKEERNLAHEESNQEKNASAIGNDNEEKVERKKKTAAKKRKHLLGDNHKDPDAKKEKEEPNLAHEESNQEKNASAIGNDNEEKVETKKKKKTAVKKRKHLLGVNDEVLVVKKENEITETPAVVSVDTQFGTSKRVEHTVKAGGISKEVLKKSTLTKKKKDEKENLPDVEGKIKSVGDNEVNSDVSPSPIVLKPKRGRPRIIDQSIETHIELPQGSVLTMVAGIEFSSEDVGSALQFLEFCAAFKKVLGIKKGQPEAVLRELLRGPVGRRGLQSSIVQFHIKLLSLIQRDAGEKPISDSPNNRSSWLRVLGECISRSQYLLKELPSNIFSKGAIEYNSLDLSLKLRVLNFLCDEILCTGELRGWIEEENLKFIERRKEASKEYLAAKEKEKCLKRKLKDEVAQAMLSLRNGAPLTVAEHDNLISEIKEKTEEVHAKTLDSFKSRPKKKLRADAVRSEPALLEESGQAFWRLKCCGNSSGTLLQDIGTWDSLTVQDKWFAYGEEQQELVEKHILFLRKLRLWKKKSSNSTMSTSKDETAGDSPQITS